MSFPTINGIRTIDFGNPGESRSKLIAFILDGNKRATAGVLQEDYIAEGEPVEHVGERLAVVDNDGEQIATLEVTRVEISRFIDVPDEFALAEAEGDLTGDDFRKSHYEFWTNNGTQITDDTEVVLMYFEVVEDLRMAK